MSDEPTIPDSRPRKWLKAIVWVYVIGMLVCDFTALQLVPLRYGMLVPHGGFVLIMLAYRPPGLKGLGFSPARIGCGCGGHVPTIDPSLNFRANRENPGFK